MHHACTDDEMVTWHMVSGAGGEEGESVEGLVRLPEGYVSKVPKGAQIVLQHSDGSSRVLGSMGALHPEVLANFDIAFPTSILEINIEPLLF